MVANLNKCVRISESKEVMKKEKNKNFNHETSLSGNFV